MKRKVVLVIRTDMKRIRQAGHRAWLLVNLSSQEAANNSTPNQCCRFRKISLKIPDGFSGKFSLREVIRIGDSTLQFESYLVYINNFIQ